MDKVITLPRASGSQKAPKKEGTKKQKKEADDTWDQMETKIEKKSKTKCDEKTKPNKKDNKKQEQKIRHDKEINVDRTQPASFEGVIVKKKKAQQENEAGIYKNGMTYSEWVKDKNENKPRIQARKTDEKTKAECLQKLLNLVKKVKDDESEKFQVIYADPPWKYAGKVENNVLGGIRYESMSTDDLCKLPIKDLAAKNSCLFMWATSPCLPDAMRCIEAFGFNFKVVWKIWIKQTECDTNPRIRYTLSHYGSACAEFLLVATRGSILKRFRTNHTSKQCHFSKLLKHSEKPSQLRDEVFKFFHVPNKLELFSRHSSIGWVSWGLDVPPNGAFLDDRRFPTTAEDPTEFYKKFLPIQIPYLLQKSFWEIVNKTKYVPMEISSAWLLVWKQIRKRDHPIFTKLSQKA
jgi:N6-adenosine-specific RNA methylase IME4